MIIGSQENNDQRDLVHSLVHRHLCLKVCQCDCFVLFSRKCSTHSRIFHSFGGDLPVANLTHARHLWPLSSKGSLVCHTNCDTGQPFIMAISETSRPMPSVWQGSCRHLFQRLSRLVFEHPSFRLQGERSNQLRGKLMGRIGLPCMLNALGNGNLLYKLVHVQLAFRRIIFTSKYKMKLEIQFIL